MYNRLELSFQPVFCLQSLPRKAYEAGYNAEMGRSFQMSPHAESPSRNEPSEWDTLSETRSIGKLCPGIRLQSGMEFPVEPRLGNGVPFA